MQGMPTMLVIWRLGDAGDAGDASDAVEAVFAGDAGNAGNARDVIQKLGVVLRRHRKPCPF